MEIFLLSVFCISILAITVLLFKNANLYRRFNGLLAKNAALLERNDYIQNQNLKQIDQIDSLEKQNNDLLIFKGRFSECESLVKDLRLQIIKLQQELSDSKQKNANFLKDNSLLEQERENLYKEKEEWSSKKQAILFQLSEELINKNNMQQNDFGKKQKEVIEKTVANLNEKFSNILNKVSSLDDDVKKTFEDVNLTKNALLNPGGAGKISEITLENILKASGLAEKKSVKDVGDFIIQSHFFDYEKSGKRPDAMVFLPKNHILIIDSKSSSHFLSLQRALEEEDVENRKEIESKLKESMRRHLEDLKKRDYSKAKMEDFDLKNFSDSKSAPNITTIMFIQTEKMLEIIRNVDPNFERRALDSRIQILSPVGLINLLYQVKFLINNVNQEKNIEKLKIEIRKLMDSVGMMIKRSSQMGESINRSVKVYNEFVGTFNSRFLPRINNMNKLGIDLDNKNNIEKLKKIAFDGALIEAEMLEDSE